METLSDSIVLENLRIRAFTQMISAHWISAQFVRIFFLLGFHLKMCLFACLFLPFRHLWLQSMAKKYFLIKLEIEMEKGRVLMLTVLPMYVRHFVLGVLIVTFHIYTYTHHPTYYTADLWERFLNDLHFYRCREDPGPTKFICNGKFKFSLVWHQS